MSEGLNWLQRTALAVTLEQLERSVDEIERALDGAPAGATYIVVLDLEPATLRQIREQCAAVRRQIADIAAAFALPPRESNVRQMIVAEMSNAWAHLEDLRPSKLQRYGDVDPILDETLAPQLERLIRLVLEIEDLARSEAQA